MASIAFSPDGNQIVVGSLDGLALVCEAKTSEQLRELQGHAGSVTTVAFSPDGTRIISGSGDYSVLLWDAKTGDPLRVFQGHTGEVASVAFSPDGNQIVSSSEDSLRVWDAKTGELRGSCKQTPGSVRLPFRLTATKSFLIPFTDCKCGMQSRPG